MWNILRPYFLSIASILPDKVLVQLLYWRTYRRFPNLSDPRTFDEKMQWYKLYYRDPLMTILADKYEVRRYVAEKGLAYILNDLYGVYEKPEEIDFSALPGSFVIRATHGSGMNIICKDKGRLNLEDSRKLLNRYLRTNYYHYGCEWVYKDIRPRLVCERYLENEGFDELVDYKFYCYGGKPEVLFVCTGRFGPGGLRYNAYDMSWNRMHVYKGRPCSDIEIERPDNLKEMIEVTRTLCEGFPFIRVDLYSIKGKITFGELTFYPDNGIRPFTPDKYNYFFGDLFVLPERR